MDSPVQICNLALVRIGVKNTIQSLTEGSVEADVCNVLYEPQRDLALASWWWGFARGQAALGQLVLDAREDWTHAYSLPADCIQPRFIWSGARTPDVTVEIPFELEADAAGENTLLWTDHDSPTLVYTRRVTVVLRYPPHFVNALAWLLAAELVLGLKLDPRLEPGARQRFEMEVAKARALDQNARHETPVKSKYERVR